MRIIVFRRNNWIEEELIFNALNELLIENINLYPDGPGWNRRDLFSISGENESAFCWHILGLSDSFAKECVSRTFSMHCPGVTEHYVSPEFVSFETNPVDRAYDIRIQVATVFERYTRQGK